MGKTRRHRRKRRATTGGPYCVRSARGKTFGCYGTAAKAKRIARRLKGKFHVKKR